MPASKEKKRLLLKNMPRGRRLDGLAAMYPETDAEAMEVYSALLEITSDILSASNSALACKGISQARFRLLLQLKRAGSSGLHPMDLAKVLGVERATVTGLVDGLEKDGLTGRHNCASDRRSILVSLTPKGERLIDSIAPDRLRRVSKLMAGLSEKEKKQLARLLDKVNAKLTEFAKP